MKKILISLLLLPLFSIGQEYTDFLPKVAWRTLVDSVVFQNTDTFTVKVNPLDLSDQGAFEKTVGNFLIDNKARKYKIIDNTQISNGIILTVEDVFKSGAAPYQGLVGYVIESPNGAFASGLSTYFGEKLDPTTEDYEKAIDLRIAYEKGQTIPFDSIRLDTGYIVTGTEPIGTRYWNENTGTTSLVSLNGTVLDDGQELWFDVLNQTGSPLINGYVAAYGGTLGASGKNLGVYGIADYDLMSPIAIIGVYTETIANGDEGKITWFGDVRGIQTNGANFGESWSAGDTLYVSTTNYGWLTKTPPEAPYPAITVAVVKYAHATNGIITVRPTLPQRMQDAPDVNGTPLIATGQFYVWDNDSGYFDANYNILDFVPESFCPDSHTIYFGDSITGSSSDLCEVDGNVFQVGEVVNDPSLQVDFVFTGVNKLNEVIFHGRFDGSSTHHTSFYIYNYNTANYDFIGRVGDSDNLEWYSFPVFLPNNYLSNDSVIVRVEHDNNANTSHSIIMDYLSVVFGGGGGNTFLQANQITFIPYLWNTSDNVQGAIQRGVDTMIVHRSDINQNTTNIATNSQAIIDTASQIRADFPIVNNSTITLQRNGVNIGDFTLNQATPETFNFIDNNTTYSAGTGLTLSGTTFNHSNSITAGNLGDSGSSRTLAVGGTFTVPYTTYDAQGHITGNTNKTLTLPSTYTPSAHTLDSHSNMAIISNTTGEILQWNGSVWLNRTLAEAGVQPTLSLTTTGNSGAASLIGNTLNIPQYTLGGLGYTVPSLQQVLTAGNTSTLAITANRFISIVATGTQPYATTSTTLNTNLNADLLDGYHETQFTRRGLLYFSGSWETAVNDLNRSATGVFTYAITGMPQAAYWSFDYVEFDNNTAHVYAVPTSATGDLYYNSRGSATWGNWRKLWHSDNANKSTVNWSVANPTSSYHAVNLLSLQNASLWADLDYLEINGTERISSTGAFTGTTGTFGSGVTVSGANNSTNWYAGYNSDVVSAAVTGTTTKTITFTKRDATTFSTNFTDLTGTSLWTDNSSSNYVTPATAGRGIRLGDGISSIYMKSDYPTSAGLGYLGMNYDGINQDFIQFDYLNGDIDIKGDVFMPDINGKTSETKVLYYNETTKEVTQGDLATATEATYTTLGVASFDSTDFEVYNGHVSDRYNKRLPNESFTAVGTTQDIGVYYSPGFEMYAKVSIAVTDVTSSDMSVYTAYVQAFFDNLTNSFNQSSVYPAHSYTNGASITLAWVDYGNIGQLDCQLSGLVPDHEYSYSIKVEYFRNISN